MSREEKNQEEKKKQQFEINEGTSTKDKEKLEILKTKLEDENKN